MKKIFVMGSLNMDVSFEVDRLPKIGETVNSRSLLINPGGKGANQAVAAARQNAEVVMLGAVGNDRFGEMLIGELGANKIDAKFIVKKNCHTGMAGILLHSGDNRIIVHGGANRMLELSDFSDVLRKEAGPGDVFITQLENSPHTVVDGLKLAKELGMITILNPAPAYKEAAEALKYCDIIIPNETETEILTGQYPCADNYESIGSKLRKYGVKTVIITCGESGSVLIDDGVSVIEAYKVEAADTTAAGDTYIGAFASLLVKGVSMTEALEYATAASAIAVTRKGAQYSIPTEAEVLKFIGNHKGKDTNNLVREKFG